MFYAWFNEGNGCDYTVGCGQKLIPLKATNHVEAVAEIEQEIEDHGGWPSENVENARFVDVKLFEAHELPFNYEGLCEQKVAEWKKDKKDKAEKRERAEFERLSKKFARKQ